MIHIRDTLASRNVPVVNNGLIVINVVVFLFEKAQGPELDRFIYYFGLVPALRFAPGACAAGLAALADGAAILTDTAMARAAGRSSSGSCRLRTRPPARASPALSMSPV